jgi:competence protein ComFC
MNFIKSLRAFILDSLFPISKQERELLNYSPKEAYLKLPKAPRPPITNAYSVFAYKDPRVTKLIWNIKYKKIYSSVAIGGYALYQKILESHAKSLVIPMPMTPRRRRERGFNQCELLIDEIKRLDANQELTFDCNLLLRTHHVSRQTLKNRKERLESAKGIFSVNEKAVQKNESFNHSSCMPTYDQTKDKTILIIDDVITTGSTMQEAMATLKKAAFKKVSGLSLAH